MIIKYEATERKLLFKAVSDFTGAKAVYLRAPSYGYQIDYFTIDRDGNLVFDDSADSEKIEKLIEYLAEQGFVAKEEGADSATQADTQEVEQTAEGDATKEETQTEGEIDALEQESAAEEEGADSATQADTQEVEQTAENDVTEEETATDGEIHGLVISIPTDKVGRENLEKLLEVKGTLIKKALGIDDLHFEEEEEIIYFPWLQDVVMTSDEAKAYTHFIGALCEMSVKQKRVTAKEKAVDNEKYAFRCFLLRLGFIGKDYKVERKILLKNFSGSSAFKSGDGKRVA